MDSTQNNYVVPLLTRSWSKKPARGVWYEVGVEKCPETLQVHVEMIPGLNLYVF